MPISINNISNGLSRVVQHLENPNYPTGVLIEEIPSDIGRTYQSYKRGGVLEGMERFMRETLSACVWLFGIPLFNGIGNFLLENVAHLPMKMDYDENTIRDTIKYLKTWENPKGFDVSELQKYVGKKIESGSIEDVVKSVKKWKGISTVSAVVLNCLMMGVLIPRFNQKLTKNRIKKMNAKRTTLKNNSFDNFKEKTSKNISFTGMGSGIVNFIKSVPYRTENDNTFRLVVTDIPTLTGRTVTSRNKYEALENLIIDGGSIFFYNFCAHSVQKLFRKITKTPALNPMATHKFVNADEKTMRTALGRIKDKKNNTLDKIFDKNTAKKIYDYSTFGKYSKINRYVSKERKREIDSEVINYLKKISSKIGYNSGGPFNMSDFTKEARKYNYKSAAFLALGYAAAIYGLSTFMPKLAFKITTLLTGKNEFTGIANFDDQNSKKIAGANAFKA